MKDRRYWSSGVSNMVILLLWVELALLFHAHVVTGLGQSPTLVFEDAPGVFKLSDSSSSVRILVDSSDWPGVGRVCKDLAKDFDRVTGLHGIVTSIQHGRSNTSSDYILNAYRNGTANTVIIAGTIENSTLIDRLVQQGSISEASLRGKWETYVTKIVNRPFPGIESALVIAGSDKRGTIYGLYDISEQIGVSPWYYWADVAPKKHSSIYALNASAVRGPPSVKYRGIFLNDEAPALTGFINAHYPRGKHGPGYNADFYATVFELLLRLKANTLWPAMWDSMFNVDDARNQPLADEYGIVMGTSHTEPMMRSTKEWGILGHGEWKWGKNKAGVTSFLAEGVRRAKPYESIFTLGMRGSGDTAMSPNIEKDTLEEIVKTQRDILRTENMTTVPQVWCLYKEVLGYYEAGMEVPDDVTMLWTDDNWGNIRRLPSGQEKTRKGGSGIYYHFDYVGDPRSYKWINTVILPKTWLQLQLAYEQAAREMWIVNVGDLKPLEVPINYFMDLAYNTTRWDQDPQEWLTLWAAREFDPSLSKDIARSAATYSRLAGLRKFELVQPDTYSLINYEEADNVLSEWQKLVQDVQALNDKIKVASQHAFFEMVLHPVLAGANFYKIQILSAKNNLFARQGRNSANIVANNVLEAFRTDHELSKRYNELLDGKWSHMMDQTHLGYSYWQQPMRQMTPALHYVQTLEPRLQGNLGVAAEGQLGSVPGDDQYHPLSSNTLVLPPYSTFSPHRWIDIFSTGLSDVSWTIEADPFIRVSQNNGTLSPNGNITDVRVYFEIEWYAKDPLMGVSIINITSSSLGATKHHAASILMPYNYTHTGNNTLGAFLEADSHIAFEAWSFPGINRPYQPFPPPDGQPFVPAKEYLLPIRDYGLTLAPFNTSALTFAAAPSIRVPFWRFSPPGNATVILHFAPSLNTDPKRPLRYGIALDKSPAREVQVVRDRPAGQLPLGWEEAVSRERWESRTEWQIGPGEHTLAIGLLDVGLVLRKVVIDFGGVRESGLGPPMTFWIGHYR